MKGFEKRLERMVEGTFARIFRSGLRPVELGRRLVRELDDGRSVDVNGRTVVPNAITVRLAREDYDNFAEVHESLCRELEEAAREHARDEGYRFMGPVEVETAPDPGLRTGAFQIDVALKEGIGGTGPGSLLLPDHRRLPLTQHVVSIGRLPECDITLTDRNASRRHAEVRPAGDGFVLVDLGSTNGCRVNGVRITDHELQDGDEIQIGNTRIVFEAS